MQAEGVNVEALLGEVTVLPVVQPVVPPIQNKRDNSKCCQQLANKLFTAAEAVREGLGG